MDLIAFPQAQPTKKPKFPDLFAFAHVLTHFMIKICIFIWPCEEGLVLLPKKYINDYQAK
jgi:hypothetical protein